DEREVDPLDDRVRETEIDGDPAGLFFFESIRVGAGERQHQGALAVIDVTGGSDDHGLGHHRQFFTKSRRHTKSTKPLPRLLRALRASSYLRDDPSSRFTVALSASLPARGGRNAACAASPSSAPPCCGAARVRLH